MRIPPRVRNLELSRVGVLGTPAASVMAAVMRALELEGVTRLKCFEGGRPLCATSGHNRCSIRLNMLQAVLLMVWLNASCIAQAYLADAFTG